MTRRAPPPAAAGPSRAVDPAAADGERGRCSPGSPRSWSGARTTSARTPSPPPARSSTADGRRRLRPGDPDPARLPRRPRHRDRSSTRLAHQWFGNSVTPEDLAGHVAQRGLRDLRGVAVGRGPRRRPRPGDASTRPYDRGEDDTEDVSASRRDPPAPRTSPTIPVYGAARWSCTRSGRRSATTPSTTSSQGWAADHRHGNAVTADFTAYVEKTSAGQGPRPGSVEHLAVRQGQAGASLSAGSGKPPAGRAGGFPR